MKMSSWREYFLTRWIFLRLLGVVYFVAFLSLWVQLEGLIGSNGILPALLPTLAWFNSTDIFLHFLCGGGVVLSLLLIVGITPPVTLFLLWLSYLSLVVISEDFLSFQWDNLLLETGFLAIFFAPFQVLPKFSCESPPSKVVLWLLRWLLFRLTFESGCVKLLSGDPVWRDLTALTYHYETQPLPTWVGWYVHQLPEWFQKFSCLVMFGIELIVPFFIFGPRRLRLIGCGILVIFQLLIALIGNYTFFNLLTIVLCVLLLDDSIIKKFLESAGVVAGRLRGLFDAANLKKVFADRRVPVFGWRPPLRQGARSSAEAWRQSCQPTRIVKDIFVVALLFIVTFISTCQLVGMFLGRRNLPQPIRQILKIAAPFRSINNYGLFAVMTTDRPEIIVEGSDDGEIWKTYEFKYKPRPLDKRPGFVAPHQPRLDWQMWFAALGRCDRNPWFRSFMEKLLEGSPEVLKLLASNPFPEGPPKEIRAVLYDYHFTDFAMKRAYGDWWWREQKGLYCPVLSRKP